MFELAPEKFYVPPVGADGLVLSLPPIAYWDPEIFDLERETVFRRSWVCVPKPLFREQNNSVRSIYIRQAHSRPYLEMLKLRNEPVKFRLLGESIMLTRGSTPKGRPVLHCFETQCRHDGYPFLEATYDTNNNYFFVCPQHGLTLDENGEFVSHPAFPNATPEQRAMLSAVPYHQKEWLDFFFICRGEPFVSFEEVMDPVFESLSRMPLTLNNFKYNRLTSEDDPEQVAEQRIIKGNWKLNVKNYLDWLHIWFIHKPRNGLADSLDRNSARMELHKHAALMWAYAANPDDGFDPKYLPDRFRDPNDPNKRVFALWWFIAPNLALNFYPWGLSVNIFMPAMSDFEKILFDPEETEFLWYHYVWDREKYKDIDSKWLNALVDREDVNAIQYQAEIAKSHSHPWRRRIVGTIPNGPNTEKGPWWFYHLLYKMMFEDGVPVIVNS